MENRVGSEDEFTEPPSRPPPKPPILQDDGSSSQETNNIQQDLLNTSSQHASRPNSTEIKDISNETHDETRSNTVQIGVSRSTDKLSLRSSRGGTGSDPDSTSSFRSESAPVPVTTNSIEETLNRKTAPGSFIKIAPRSRRPPPLIVESKAHPNHSSSNAVSSTRVLLVISDRKKGFGSDDDDSFLLGSFSKASSSSESSTRSSMEVKSSSSDPLAPLERKYEWRARLMNENPDIKAVSERVHPLERTIAFGSHCIQKKTQEFSKEQILMLIAQHLHLEGLKSSRAMLEEAADLKVPSEVYNIPESKLATILRIAVKDVNQVFDSTMADRWQDEEENYGEVLEHLYDLGILEQTTSASDVNLWEEPFEGNAILDSTGGLKAATLNQLVVYLTTYQNQDFLKAFLMTYQIFTTPEILLAKLIQRYKPPPNATEVKDIKSIQIRVGIVLLKWMEEYLQEIDLNDQLLSSVKMFLERFIKKDSFSMYHKIDSTISRKIRGDDTPKISMTLSFQAVPEPKVNISTIFHPDLSILDIDDLEIARQLCLLEFQIFAKIKSSELLNQAWLKPKLKHKSPNVLATSQRSTIMSAWICTLILKPEKLRDRVKMFTKMVRVAEQLRKLNNIADLMTFLGALNSNPIFRLRFTKEESSKEIQKALEALDQSMSSLHNFKLVREAMSQARLPCIPYLGIFQTDLVFLDEGYQNFMAVDGKELINFQKFKLIYQQIEKIQRFQHKSYNFHPVHQIQALLTNSAMQKIALSQEELWDLSLIREPRDVESVP